MHRPFAGALVLGVAGTAPVSRPVSAQVTPDVFAPAIVSVEGQSLYRGAFSPDGRAFYFFRKVTPGQEDYRIFVTRRDGADWSPAERVDLGGEYSDLYPTISPDGGRMVFASYRPAPGDTGSHPNANLWYANRAGSGWGTPVYMAAASTQANYDSGPAFLGDGAVRYVSTDPDWRTRHIRLTRWEGSSLAPPSEDTLPALWWRLAAGGAEAARRRQWGGDRELHGVLPRRPGPSLRPRLRHLLPRLRQPDPHVALAPTSVFRVPSAPPSGAPVPATGTRPPTDTAHRRHWPGGT